MTKFDVDPDGVKGSTGDLIRCADRVGEVATVALGQSFLTPVAFGIMCSFAVPMVQMMQSRTQGAIVGLSAALQAEAAAVTAASVAYRALDDQVAAAVGNLQQRWDA